eukprot:8366702-Alexandrium_andersonii.AAC.1
MCIRDSNYSIGTWAALPETQAKRFHIAMMKCARALVPKMYDRSDEEVLRAVQLPMPKAVLMRARLWFFSRWAKTATDLSVLAVQWSS